MRPLQETLLLDVFGHVQEELDDNDPVVNQVLLEVVDLLEAPSPNTLVLQCGRELLAGEELGMYAHYQDFFIVGTVENPDTAARRQGLEVTPQIIVVQFLTGRPLETVDIDPLWVDARHDVLDGAVLAGCIEGLKDHKQGILVLGPELVLHLGQHLDAFGQGLFGLFLRHPFAGEAWIVVLLQVDLLAGRNPHDVQQFFNSGFHIFNSSCHSLTPVLFLVLKVQDQSNFPEVI